MQIDIYGQHLEITPGLREHVNHSMARLARHFGRDCTIHLQLGVEKFRHRAEANVVLAGRALHADVRAHDMYAAIDLLTDKLDRLLLREKERRADHHRGERAARLDAFA